jgi:hypothetical protein
VCYTSWWREAARRARGGVSEKRSPWKEPPVHLFGRTVAWSTGLSHHHRPSTLAAVSQGSRRRFHPACRTGRCRWKLGYRRPMGECGAAERVEVWCGDHNRAGGGTAHCVDQGLDLGRHTVTRRKFGNLCGKRASLMDQILRAKFIFCGKKRISGRCDGRVPLPKDQPS